MLRMCTVAFPGARIAEQTRQSAPVFGATTPI
jgi:hypothetical protein